MVSSFHTASAQQLRGLECNTLVFEKDIARLLENKKNTKTITNRTNTIDFVPLQFHIIGNIIGNTQVIENIIFDAVCKLNSDYSKTNIQFYIFDKFNYINNNLLNNITFPYISPEAASVLSLTKKEGAINIFIGKNLTSGSSAFYDPNLDLIYIDKNFIGADDIILSHEIGHYFGLLHTFSGWEETVYNPNLPTPLFVYRGSTAYFVEFVDRNKNCETAGDFLCGTPADYILYWGSGCHYNGGGVDPDGVYINPDESNIMGYYSFAGCYDYGFSDDQAEVIYADFLSREDLVQNKLRIQEQISDTLTLTSPLSGIETIYTDVTFKWEAVENATTYILELSLSPNFSEFEKYILLHELEYTAYFLKNDSQYYWRILAMNETNPCDRKFSEIRTFNTVDYASDIDEIYHSSGFSIFPNPLKSFSKNFFLNSKNNYLGADLKIYNLHGMEIHSLNQQHLTEGINEISIPEINILSPGIYFLSINHNRTKKMLKFIVI